VVPTFRRPDALQETLEALIALDYERDRYEVIVVDDASETSTGRIVDGLRGSGVSLTLLSQKHRGAARARNRGAELAGAEFILFCDDDMIVEPSHLRLHAAAAKRHEHALVSGAWDFAPDVMAALAGTPFGRYRIELERRFQHHDDADPVEDDPGCILMPVLGSGNLALKRELFRKIGGFDEDFPVAGAEDQDFSIRARRAGAVLLLDTKIRCLQNDNRVTVRSYCAREERSAQTMPFLARKYPSEFMGIAYVRENRPIQAEDPIRLKLKKLVKQALAYGPALQALHAGVRLLEIVHVPDRRLRGMYRGLLGLHLFRGFRRAWRE
jgi:GT2 family glycosyltransferase